MTDTIHGRLEASLARYDGLVSQALVSLDHSGEQIVCELDIVARWWGPLSVYGRGADAPAALDAAFRELSAVLDAFVAEIPRSQRAQSRLDA